MQRKNTSQAHFAQVPNAEIQRSTFDRSHGLKTTFDGGLLIPVFVDEVLPGDTFNLSMTAFARLATPIKPIMDNIYLESFFFFVPNRLVWDNWEKMNGQQDNPGDSTDYLTPLHGYGATPVAINSLGDYFGLPTGVGGVDAIALPFRAYNLIWNEWFRDQNLQDSAVVDKDDGPDNPNQYVVRRRGKRRDYFTSALPWPQKGPAVQLPLGGNAPVITGANQAAPGATVQPLTWRNQLSPNAISSAGTLGIQSGNGQTVRYASTETIANNVYPANLYADLSEVTAATINSLRQAFQLQRLYERDARGGTRYTEIIRSHFGVTSPDQRLQRPEYLGGGSSPVNINPIAQTSAQENQPTPQGNLSAIGTASINGHSFSKSFVEHGIIIGLVNVRADLTYQQGINRMWSRRTRFDYYFPVLAHLGEQAILNKEIYYQNNAADDEVFGYQERYAEYRYKPSQITSIFRSTAPASLDVWHLSQEFGALPTLNSTFIEDNPPIDRIIAVPSEPHFIADFHFNLRCARPMPVYSVPGLIDHF